MIRKKFDKFHWVRISNFFRLYVCLKQSCDALLQHMRIDLPATFRKIFQDIFSSFEFGSELDPKNARLLGIVVGDHIYGLAFNLGNLWESRPKFNRGQ